MAAKGESLQILFHASGLQEAFTSFEPILPSSWSVYVECLDSTFGNAYILSVLQYLKLLPPNASEPVLSQDLFGHLSLSDRALFSDYDALWVIWGAPRPVKEPPFFTYMAAEGPEWYPIDKETKQPLGSWLPVQQWMEENDVILGFATAQKCVSIYRPNWSAKAGDKPD
jgi:hypothetical protein